VWHSAGVFGFVAPTRAEVAAPRAGDDLVIPADVVLDRAFTVPGPPERVWPWLVQLGKRRAGWYLPRALDRFLPRRGRAARAVEPRWQTLAEGDVIPDYGGRNATFTVDQLTPPQTLVFRSLRGRTEISWAIGLHPVPAGTRIWLRLRMGPVRHRRPARTLGGLVDLLTIAGLAAGLRERLR
jgi:hypothetical protein